MPIGGTRRALGARFALVNILTDDHQLTSGAIGAQVSKLHIAILIFGGDSGIDSDSHTMFYGRKQRDG